MSVKTEAWVIRQAESKDAGHAELERTEIEFDNISSEEVLVRPLFGCWEGNMGHAIERDPVDIARQRDEEYVVMGNAGVVEIVECGDDVTTVKEGDKAILFCNGIWDEYGYPKKIFGFDCKGTIGMLAKKTKLHQKQVIPIPDCDRDMLRRWAGFSLRYPTAWSNWRLAYGTLRLLLDQRELPDPIVWGWGGGVTLGQLDLARRHGCDTVQISGNSKRRAAAEKLGIDVVDRSQFRDLYYDPKKFRKDEEYTENYLAAEKKFLDIVDEKTDGRGVNIFIDYVGQPVIRGTHKALARQGVIATAGWKEGMSLQFLRAIECIKRHQHIHTHYARYEEGIDSVRYAIANDWLPDVDEREYTFDDVPKLSADYLDGDFVYFPIYEVNPV
jgi:NADPH:quinone reductase-like Zn-dependent oxidoreductase